MKTGASTISQPQNILYASAVQDCLKNTKTETEDSLFNVAHSSSQYIWKDYIKISPLKIDDLAVYVVDCQ